MGSTRPQTPRGISPGHTAEGPRSGHMARLLPKCPCSQSPSPGLISGPMPWTKTAPRRESSLETQGDREAGTVPSKLHAYTAHEFLLTDSGQKALQRHHTRRPALPKLGDPWDRVGGASDAAQPPSTQDTPWCVHSGVVHPTTENDPAPNISTAWGETLVWPNLSPSQSLLSKASDRVLFPS